MLRAEYSISTRIIKKEPRKKEWIVPAEVGTKEINLLLPLLGALVTMCTTGCNANELEFFTIKCKDFFHFLEEVAIILLNIIRRMFF